MEFNHFGEAVAKHFKSMAATGLFRTGVEKDRLWDTYLASFAPGTNPTFRTRSEHDCTVCRHFVKTLGGVVTIVDNQMVTLWDFDADNLGRYAPVAQALSALVKQASIENIFLHPEKTVGTQKTFDLTEGRALSWKHFNVNLPASAYLPGLQIGPRLSETRSTFDVMRRGLVELTGESVDMVLELIAQNSLYRGEEHKGALQAFKTLQQKFAQATNKDLFCWSTVATSAAAVSRLRATAIGTLLIDLSKGEDLETAVKAFERIVAPTNYKRPTALVTKAMIAKAQQTITDLGYMSALERRYARIEDITINNVLFANRESKKAMNVFDSLSASVAVDPKKLGKVEDVPAAVFFEKILPTAKSLEVFFANSHQGNLVSLIAPVDPTAKHMFKWNNNFSWSYAGELADSIKERVKAAGGNVTGDFRASLSWHNYDDQDLHLKVPTGEEISFRRKIVNFGGNLDVDMNAGWNQSRTAVENIVYPTARTMPRGTYELFVNQFGARESTNIGFEVELEFLGTVYSFAYNRPMRSGDNVIVARFNWDGKTLEMLDGLPSTTASRTVWGLSTQVFQPVDVVMLSPNYWDDQTAGNKHFFFMLRGCQQEGQARGFYNEFLSQALDPHRKVLEMVGSKFKTDASEFQLSGLGFSSTQRNSLLVKVTGASQRVVNVIF